MTRYTTTKRRVSLYNKRRGTPQAKREAESFAYTDGVSYVHIHDACGSKAIDTKNNNNQLE